ncbi:prolyl oligopeptidase family protein [Flavobacterium sp. 270]|uniref:alpha/beta hydrolase family protein n=1 Tax=Flavobacterium sp. 270 TaxID=2512114 RepID=UPI0010D6D50C|nr:YqiA/YcfP family alpha/beta fold hydrolase [Flavobacterium sp. 270]TDW46682.1 prolyl oligopeptidase family protein [Flavobacterium sp. 270]
MCGHSFGGYEANFIITQSDIFAAAVSGAGISDTTGFYFNISKNGTFQSEMWRFESQQWRMGKSLYEDKKGYIQSSPIINAEKNKTPLLLWAGKQDRVVPYAQSISYYLAMRKLQVKSIMLVYPKEDHTLENPSNKEDLSRRMMDWFDYFLKRKSDSEWISTGTSID